MSGQLLELIIFACIAFFIINKLITMLGKTSEEDTSRGRSFFNKNTHTMQDVTSTSKNKINIVKSKFIKKKIIDLEGLVVPGSETEIKHGIYDIQSKLPNFSLKRFLTGAKNAFRIIIKSGENNAFRLEELVDKRYIAHFKTLLHTYGVYNDSQNQLIAQVSEIYMFGNNIFVKVLFTGQNITSNINSMNEEWNFTKSTLNSRPEWYLTNIDKPH